MSFILSGTMIFLNLLVGVIVNNMSELSGDKAPDAPASSTQDDAALARRVERIESLLERVAVDVESMRRSGGGR